MKKIKKVKKEWQPLVKAAKSQGWQIGLSGGGHLVWLSPTGHKIFSPSTPSDYHSIRNVTRDLRHEGLNV